MTAAMFANLVNAQFIGAGRWKARCPAHDDRSPSLSIREGDDGRVLVYCHAGCSLSSILTVLKLGKRDLFSGPLPSPERLAAMEAGRIAAEQQRRATRATEREAWDKVRRWSAVVDALGAKLARTPENLPVQDALNKAFHDACKRRHDAEVAALELSGGKAAA